MAQARAFSHVGLTVPDLDKAVDFYTKVFGWYVIMKPTEVVEDDSAIGVMCKDVFGEGFGRFRIAHLSTSDKIGVEMFEWPDTVKPKIIWIIRKAGSFTSACRIRKSKKRSRKSSPTAESRGCPSGSITLESVPTAWCTWRPLRERVRALQPQLRAHLLPRRLPGLSARWPVGSDPAPPARRLC